MASTLVTNANARGVARAAGTPIVNAKPVVPPPAPTPVPGQSAAPKVDLATHTYSGPAPAGAATSEQKASGVDLNTRTAMSTANPQQDALAAAERLAAERQAAIDVQNRRDAELSRLNLEKSRLQQETGQVQDYNYIVQTNPDGTTKIAKVSGYNPDTGFYSNSEDVAGMVFGSPSKPATPGSSSSSTTTPGSMSDSDRLTQIAQARKDFREGVITQEQLNQKISALNRGGPTSTASGNAQNRISEIDQRLNELNQPIDFSALYSYLDNVEAAELSASREKEKAALIEEKNKLASQLAGGGATPTVMGGASGGTKPGTTPAAPKANLPQTSTNAAIQSMIATSPPEVASFLQTAFGILNQRMANGAEQYTDDVTLADAEYAQFSEIIGDMLQRQDGMMQLKQKILASRSAEDKMVLDQQKTMLLQKNQTERQMAQLKANQQVRETEKAWAKRVESMGNRLSVLGGYGSMANIKDIEKTQTEGSQAVADFVMEVALNDQKYADRAMEIESNWTAAVVQINRAYADGMLSSIEKYNDKVDDIKQLQFGSTQRRFDAIRNAKSKLRDDWNKTQEKAIELFGQASSAALQERHMLETQMRQDKKDLWNDTMQYVGMYGTQDKEFLAEREKELGLPAGALSRMTLEELRMKKSAAGAGAATGASQAWLQETVDKLRQQFPTDSPNEILKKAAYVANQRFGGTSKGNLATKNAIYETIGEELGEVITTASLTGEIKRIQAQSSLRSRVLNSPDPEGEMTKILGELTKGSKAPFKGDEEAGSKFLLGLFEGTDVSGNARPTVGVRDDIWDTNIRNPFSRFSFER